MQTTSSQRWAIGAVGLAILLACTPQAEETQEAEAPPAATSTAAPSDAARLAGPAPGYADAWAASRADCNNPARVIALSGERIDMPADDRSCAVTSIDETHPTGRSAVYHVAAACNVGDQPSRDQFTFRFGAADTVMELQLNDLPPVRVERCPPANP